MGGCAVPRRSRKTNLASMLLSSPAGSGALLEVKLGPEPRRSRTLQPFESPATDCPGAIVAGITTTPLLPPSEAQALSICAPTEPPLNVLALAMEANPLAPTTNHVRWSLIPVMPPELVVTEAIGTAPAG